MTAQQVQPSPELTALYERIEKGITWLSSNDEHGAFHLWFASGILPFAPMPSQTSERKEAYARYHKNRTVFEKLWREMENREKQEGVSP